MIQFIIKKKKKNQLSNEPKVDNSIFFSMNKLESQQTWHLHTGEVFRRQFHIELKSEFEAWKMLPA